jgi:hypothetical protein
MLIFYRKSGINSQFVNILTFEAIIDLFYKQKITIIPLPHHVTIFANKKLKHTHTHITQKKYSTCMQGLEVYTVHFSAHEL